MSDVLRTTAKVSLRDHAKPGDNFLYGYNSARQASVNLYKVNIAHLTDKRAKVNEDLKPVMLHWFCNLIAFAATEHFVKDGDPARPAYGDKLANDFAAFLTSEIGIQSEKTVLKYSSVVSGALGIRNKAKEPFDPLPGLRMIAVDQGVPGIIKYLERAEIKTFNRLLEAVQPGAKPMVALAARVAGLNDEQRKEFERALAVAMRKVANKPRKAPTKARATTNDAGATV